MSTEERDLLVRALKAMDSLLFYYGAKIPPRAIARMMKREKEARAVLSHPLAVALLKEADRGA